MPQVSDEIVGVAGAAEKALLPASVTTSFIRENLNVPVVDRRGTLGGNRNGHVDIRKRVSNSWLLYLEGNSWLVGFVVDSS